MLQDLPWTPARYRKFKDAVEVELALPCDYIGTLEYIVADLSERYILRFFSEIWKPRTNDYDYTGWALAEAITKEEYERRAKNIGKIDFSKLSQYEMTDNTTGAKEFACVSGVCDIV